MMAGQEPPVKKLDPIIELKNKYKRKAIILTVLMSLALALLVFATCFIQIAPGVPLVLVILLISIPCSFDTLVKAFYEWLTKDFDLDNMEDENS
jgi:hypothetical protein